MFSPETQFVKINHKDETAIFLEVFTYARKKYIVLAVEKLLNHSLLLMEYNSIINIFISEGKISWYVKWQNELYLVFL